MNIASLLNLINCSWQYIYIFPSYVHVMKQNYSLHYQELMGNLWLEFHPIKITSARAKDTVLKVEQCCWWKSLLGDIERHGCPINREQCRNM